MIAVKGGFCLKDNDSRQNQKIQWVSMTFSQKLRYFWDYYKLPALILLLLVYIAGYSAYKHMSAKEPVLYCALINVSLPEETTALLNDGFLSYNNYDSSSQMLTLYQGWYLTDRPESDMYQYVQASQMKILASINAEQLDIVFFDREAFDAFAQNGYLYPIDQFLDTYLSPDTDLLSDTSGQQVSVSELLADRIVSNMEILEDSAKDLVLDPSATYTSQTREYPMAIDISDCKAFQNLDLSGSIYLGIIANTSRPEATAQYIKYLTF